MMQPNAKKHTVLPVPDGIQGVKGKPDVGNGEKTAPLRGVSKKMIARSRWDDQIQVFYTLVSIMPLSLFFKPVI